MTDAAAEEIALSVPRSTFFLGLVRRLVADAAARAGFGAAEAGEIEIAVEAAVARVIERGPPAAGDLAGHDRLAVTARIGAEALEIRIRDYAERDAGSKADSAAGIDWDYAQEYDLAGFDDFVVRTFDEVEFTHRSKLGNDLRLVRAIPPGRPRAGREGQ